MIVVLVGVSLAAYLMLPSFVSAGMAGTVWIMTLVTLAAYWRGKNVHASDQEGLFEHFGHHSTWPEVADAVIETP